MTIPPPHTRPWPTVGDTTTTTPAADEIFGGRPADRTPLALVVDLGALDGLAGDATTEMMESALVRVRASLGDDVDSLTRETTRATIRGQYPQIPARMVDAALAPRPAPSTDDDDRPRRSQATRLLELADAAGAEWWHSPEGDPHVTLAVDSHREHHRVTSRAVRDWLARAYYVETAGAPGAAAMTDALAVLSGRARYDGAEYTTAVRVGGDLTRVYLDLGDPAWRAVEVTPSGWRIVADPPIRFVRARGARALPMPMPGGSIDALREILGIDAEAHRLVIGWLIGALRPAGPYPVLALTGEQGAGKSTAARLIRRLVDPHVAELRAEPRQIDDLMIAAARARVVALDNVSHIEPWLSDTICRLATGGAISRRTLYTDDDETIIDAMRPVIVTAIGDVMTRGDLLDRAMCVTLPPVPEADRQTEAEMVAVYDLAAPGIIGALLDAVASALRRQAETVVDRLPRMADWAVWVTAAEPGLDWPAGGIVDAYRAMRTAAVETALDGDALAVAIRRMSMPWSGTAADLLALLDPSGRRPRGWPESPRGMSAALRRLAPHLRRAGIDVVMYREAGSGSRRLVRLEGVPPHDDAPGRDTPGEPSQSAQPSQGPALLAGSATVGLEQPSPRPSQGDGCDGRGDGRPSSSSPDQARGCDGSDHRDGCDGRPPTCTPGEVLDDAV